MPRTMEDTHVSPARRDAYPERGVGNIPRGILPSGLPDLPSIPPYDEVGPLDARALSKTLFARLETLEEGTPSTRTSAAP